VKFKLDENLPIELASDLRALEHNVDTVHDEGLRGAPDQAVVEAALTANRVLFTLDKGIANLPRYPMHGHAGVVLFRPNRLGRKFVLRFIQERLTQVLGMDLRGRLNSGRPTRIRFR
jgi:predicted nuclease of predicted toxin-antitoxin system